MVTMSFFGADSAETDFFGADSAETDAPSEWKQVSSVVDASSTFLKDKKQV